MPRESKLTEETTERLVRLVRAGNYRETAAAACGIAPRTLRKWLQWGAEGKEPYATFSETVDRAEAESEARDVAFIGTAGQSDWRAAAHRLERKHPKRWGKQVRIVYEDVIRKVLSVAERVLAPEVFELLVGELAQVDSAGDPIDEGLDDDIGAE